MPNKILLILQLIRFFNPTGYLLPFFTSCFGLALAMESVSDIKLIPLFFIGSVVARSAGCIINDILDRKFDARVERTMNRPLANNSLSVKEAIIVLGILLIIGLAVLLSLKPAAIYLGLISIIFITLYPLMKRITNLAQVFLGLTFNFGVLIGYAAVADTLSLPAILIYIGSCFWTIGYDTVYGFMDIIDDKKIGVKSMAILLEEKSYKAWLYGFYCIFISLFAAASLMRFHFVDLVTSLLALAILSWQVRTLDIKSPKNCLVRFKSNNYVGAVLAVSLLVPAWYYL